MKTFLLFLSAAAIGLGSITAASAASLPDQSCINLKQIDSSPIIDDHTILVKLNGNGGYRRVELGAGCSALRWDGYARSSPQEAMCTADTLHPIGPTGGSCTIEKIVSIDVNEAKALEARKFK